MKCALLFVCLLSAALVSCVPHHDHAKDDHTHAPNEAHTSGHTHHANGTGHDHKRELAI